MGAVAWGANDFPVQTFYIPRPEDEMLVALNTIAGGRTDQYKPQDPVQSYVSIAVFADNTKIYYDQWENGFDPNISSPTNLYNAVSNPGGTQIWGDGNPSNGYPPGHTNDLLMAGNVVLLTNAVVSTSRGSVIYYDGGDKIAATKPIAVTRATWASGSSTMFANANEVYDTAFWGTSFLCPVGTNIADSVDYQMFEYTGFSIMAGAGGATVRIDADADGLFETNCVLAEGQACLINGGVAVGGRVVSDRPVQVDLLTADIYDNFESRFMRLLPTAYWSSSATTPVSTPLTVTTNSTTYSAGTTVWLYNALTNALPVLYVSRTSTGLSTNVLTVPGGPSGGYLKQVVANGVGARFIATNGIPFYALATVDSTGTDLSTSLSDSGDNRTWDWGFTLVPESSLTPQVLVGLGIGRDPTSTTNPSEDGSPVWVTPIGNGNSSVTVYVDYDSDPTTGAFVDPNGNRYDASYTAKELDQLKIFNPSGDQTGMLVYVLDAGVKLAAAWGEDPLSASVSAPGLDMGTGIPPFPLFVARKKSVLLIDADNDGYVSPGDTLRYSIVIENTGRQPVTDLDVKDVLPSGLTYLANTTFFVNAASVTNAIADNTSAAFQTVFPLDEGGITLPDPYLPVRSSWEVLYTTRVKEYSELPAGTISLQNTATVGGAGLTTTNSVTTLIRAKIGDYVWWDKNENGLQDADEPGVNGVGVSLLTADGSPVLDDNGRPLSTVTSNSVSGAAGYYLFKGVAAGTYMVRFSSPTGFTFTAQNADGMDIGGPLNSDVDPASGLTPAVALDGGETNMLVDAGLIEARAAVTGYVRVDEDGDGVVDAADVDGVAGATVLLLNAASNVVATTTTDNGGGYAFASLKPGSYTVALSLPSGFSNTCDTAGANDLRIPVTLAAGATSDGNCFYAARSGAATTAGKVLYLSEGQTLDRVDPVAANDLTTALTSDFLVQTVAVVNVSSGSANASTLTLSSFASTGTNRLLLVGLSLGASNRFANTVIYGSAALTRAGYVHGGSGTTTARTEIWWLANPPVSTSTVTVTLNSLGTTAVGAVLLNGVNTTSPLGAFASKSGNSTAPSVTIASSKGEWVFDTLTSRSTTTPTAGSGQTREWVNTSQSTLAGAASVKTGAVSTAMSWTAGSAVWALGAVSVRPAPAANVAAFTQSPSFALPFSLAAGTTLTVTGYVGVTSGQMPANPSVVAQLSAGGTPFLTMANPAYSSVAGALVWSGTLASAVDVSAGAAISLSVSNALPGVGFRLRYDSASYPSKIILPTASIIAVPSLGVYDAAYPNGIVGGNGMVGGARYIRMTVTDPFGSADISSADLTVDGPGASGDLLASLTDAQMVASNAWSKTYEYVWNTSWVGAYALTATAHEGSEGVTAVAHAAYTLRPPVVSLGDFVWVDGNGDGRQDAGEPGLSNVVVRLYDTNGVVLATVTSTVSGAYAFTDQAAGTYAVGFTPPAGYLFTTSNVGGDAVDSDPIPGSNRTAFVTLPAGTNDMALDAGFYAVASVSGFVRVDANGNGVFDAGETNGVAGATVQLLDAASGVVASASTAQDGSYTFGGLRPGAYTVRMTSPAGWYCMFDSSGPNDGRIPVTVSSGLSSVGNMFYIAYRVAVGGLSWVDTNGNGQQDAGEPGLSNVVVRLCDTNGTVLAVATGAVSGAYAFTNRAAGSYTVDFTPPAGYLFTTSNVGSDATDSDPLPGTNRTAAVTLASGQTDNTVSAGFIPAASVSGFVLVDANGNGVADAGDTAGVGGATVQLLDAASNVLATATTASDGSYLFAGLRPGAYIVRETDPAGWYSTADSAGPNDNLIPVTVAIGQNAAGSAFYDTQRTAVGGLVWVDTNGNGQQDSGEPGLSGVVVCLYGTNGVVLATVTGAVSGAYAFTNLAAGTYTLGFSPPSGYLFTRANAGSDATDSDALPGTGRTAAVTLVSGQTDTTVAAGFCQPASFAGSVFLDANGNGVADASETNGLVGVTILLVDASSNTVATATTSVTGGYLFAGLAPGSYTAVQVLPAGYSNTFDTVGNNDLCVPWTLTSGQNATGGNFYDAWVSTPVRQGKVLYLSDPGQALDRVDPVASGDQTTAVTPELYAPVVANDANSSSNANASSLTFAHTVGTGTNRLLLVSVAVRSTSVSVSSVTYGGVALTQCGSASAAQSVRVYIYRLLNPASGSGNVEVTLGGGAAHVAAGASSFVGVNQSQPLGTFVSATASSATPNVTVSTTPGAVVFDAVSAYSAGAATPSSDQTQLWANDSQTRLAAGSSKKPGNSSVIMSWSCDTAYWVIGAVPILPATQSPTATFTQTPAFALPFALSAGTTVSVTGYVNATTGTLPANPSVVARLSVGDTVFASLDAPLYDSARGVLSWSGALPSSVAIPAGSAISITVSNAQANTGFRLRYDSASYPSKIVLPTTTIIAVPSLGVYSAAYSNGVAETASPVGAVRYVRVTATDPFGFADVTGVDLAIDGPGVSGDASVSLTDARVVASNAWSKTYEYAWTTSSATGTYSVVATAHEGSEGIVATAKTSGTLYNATIAGRVFVDYNNNGEWDEGEGVSGVVVTVSGPQTGYGTAGALSVSSGADGAYSFNGLAASVGGSEYTVTVATGNLPTGMTVNTVDPDGGNDSAAAVTLSLAAPSLTNTDFGYRSPATYSVSGVVLLDADRNNVISEEDVVVKGVIVRLYTDPNGDGDPSDGVLVGNVRSGPDGSYAFGNLLPGNYLVVSVIGGEKTKNALAVALENADSPNNDFLNEVDPSGYFYDTADGRIVAGGSIAVSGTNAVILMDGSTGEYMFIGTNGVRTVYTVSVTPPPGYVIDPDRPAHAGTFDPTGYTDPVVMGSGLGTNANCLANWSAVSNTYYVSFELEMGDPRILNNNIPLVKAAAVGDRVWVDTDGNGVQDADEPGLTNVTVRLYDSDGAEVSETQTGVDGAYLFADLTPGTYRVGFVAPSGYVFTTNHVSAETSAVDSDAIPGSGQTGWLALGAGETNATVDAGLYIPAAVYGYLFVDKNNDCLRNDEDKAVTNALVRLSRGGAVVASTNTDAAGYYWFGNLAPGTVTVLVSRASSKLCAVPTAEPAASDPSRNRALADASGSDAYIAVRVVSGQGATAALPGETQNAGFVSSSMSAAMDFRVYASGDGTVLVDIWTVNEAGCGDIVVYAWIGNAWVKVACVTSDQVVGEGSNKYTVTATGLSAGSAYYFRIVDEAGHVHDSSEPVEVSTLRVSAVRLTLERVVLTFNTEYGNLYRVMVSDSLAGSSWTNECVSVDRDGIWTPYSSEPFMAGTGGATTVRIPVNRSRAFFKVVLIDSQ